ncbi:MAG TPA: VWA domain-containing protein, partial [Kofleriaceae bacterium]|nr:VWA domain-containing protein [Kofleriaceae bacterium]
LLTPLAMRVPSSIVMVFLAACGMQSASRDGAAPGAGGDSGGGVSFGGAQDVGEFRGILDRGEIPGPDTLDANGFFNEHFNAPPPASCGALLCAVPGMSVGRDWLTGAHQATLQISVSTTVDPTAYQRLPMNLVVVVDHSGSMASDGRLDKVKVGLHAMIDNLHDEDRLAIVEFDDRVDIDAPFAATLDRPALHAIIDRLQPRGATNIFDGLRQGFLLLGDAPASERQNRVIFLSDGNATSGDTVQAHILAMAASRVKLGIGLTTIGVGNDFDVALMRGLAEQGAGNFYFLEDPTAATEVFSEELDYFVQPLALDVQLEATAGPGYQFGEVVGSHLWSAEARRGSMQIPAVFVASRTTQSGGQGRRGGGSMIFIHMTPIAGNTGRVADVTLSYRTPGSAERISQTVSVNYAADPTETPAQPYLSAPEMAERYAMYNMFIGLRAATQASDPSCAMAALDATRASATEWNRSHEDPDLAADLMLVDQYRANLQEYVTPRGPGACPALGEPYPPIDGQPIEPIEPIDYPHHRYACSTGGASGGLPILLGALAVGLGRRRRRG